MRRTDGRQLFAGDAAVDRLRSAASGAGDRLVERVKYPEMSFILTRRLTVHAHGVIAYIRRDVICACSLSARHMHPLGPITGVASVHKVRAL